MKRVIAITLLGMLCSCAPTPAPAPADPMADPARTQVNDHLRAACAGFTPTDADIETLLSLAESDRLDGVSYSAEMSSAVNCRGCDPATAILHQRCGTAIVDQVYGK